jgi:predicted phage tail protein
MLTWLQQNPIVVDLGTQPPPARDISIDTVLGIFALAGAFLAAAAVGSALVAGGMLL